MAQLPSLFVPQKPKEQIAWAKKFINAIEKKYEKGSSLYSERIKDYENYDIFSGSFDTKQFEFLTDTYGLTAPARLVNYPIIKPKVDLLAGEFLNQPLQFTIEVVNRDAVLKKEDKKIGLIVEKLTKPIREEIKSMLGEELEFEESGIELPEDLDEMMRMNFRENVEVMAHNGLEYLMQKYSYKSIFEKGFYDLCISSKEFYKASIVNGDPSIRRVDPRSIIYDYDSDTEDLDECQWVGEERFMTVSEIMDEFGDSLSRDEVVKLESIRQSQGQAGLKSLFPKGTSNLGRYFSYGYDDGARVRVVYGEWKALRKVRIKISENKHDKNKPFRKILPDDYKARKSDNIEIKYVNDIWQATKIGPDICLLYTSPSPRD